MEVTLKVQNKRDSSYEQHKVEWCFYVQATFANLIVLSIVIPITKCLPFFFRTDANFYQKKTLPHILRRGPNESTMKNVECNQS